MKLPIHFVAIGTELLQGKLQDANGYWLSQFLASKGIKLAQITILDDDENALDHFFNSQDLSSQFVITSGGLGPTKDDKTKGFFSKLTNSPLIESDDALKLAKEHYSRINRDFDANQTGYHQIPDTWEALSNLAGLAPGLLKQDEAYNILALPGVPREFQAIIKSLESRFFQTQATQYQKISVRVFGLSEEKIFFEKAPRLWAELETMGEVSCLPSYPHLDIGIAGKNLIASEFKDCIHKHLPDAILCFEMLSIEEIILKKLKARNLTLAIAESCTAGLCSHLLTQISGASHSFLGGIVSYSNEVKINNLNVSKDIIDKETVYSHAVAKAMSIGVKQQLKADIGLATTGIAGPNGGSLDNPVGSIYIGITCNGETESETRKLNGDRDSLKKYFANFAFLTLLKKLESLT